MQGYTMRSSDVLLQFQKEPTELETYVKATRIHKAYVLPIICKHRERFYMAPENLADFGAWFSLRLSYWRRAEARLGP